MALTSLSYFLLIISLAKQSHMQKLAKLEHRKLTENEIMQKFNHQLQHAKNLTDLSVVLEPNLISRMKWISENGQKEEKAEVKAPQKKFEIAQQLSMKSLPSNNIKKRVEPLKFPEIELHKSDRTNLNTTEYEQSLSTNFSISSTTQLSNLILKTITNSSNIHRPLNNKSSKNIEERQGNGHRRIASHHRNNKPLTITNSYYHYAKGDSFQNLFANHLDRFKQPKKEKKHSLQSAKVRTNDSKSFKQTTRNSSRSSDDHDVKMLANELNLFQTEIKEKVNKLIQKLNNFQHPMMTKVVGNSHLSKDGSSSKHHSHHKVIARPSRTKSGRKRRPNKRKHTVNPNSPHNLHEATSNYTMRRENIKNLLKKSKTLQPTTETAKSAHRRPKITNSTSSAEQLQFTRTENNTTSLKSNDSLRVTDSKSHQSANVPRKIFKSSNNVLFRNMHEKTIDRMPANLTKNSKKVASFKASPVVDKSAIIKTLSSEQNDAQRITNPNSQSIEFRTTFGDLNQSNSQEAIDSKTKPKHPNFVEQLKNRSIISQQGIASAKKITKDANSDLLKSNMIRNGNLQLGGTTLLHQSIGENAQFNSAAAAKHLETFDNFFDQPKSVNRLAHTISANIASETRTSLPNKTLNEISGDRKNYEHYNNLSAAKNG